MRKFPKRWTTFSIALGLVFTQLVPMSPAALAQSNVIRYEWDNSPSALKVLFIGNSFTYTVPQIFAGLVKSGGRPAKVAMAAYPSYSLDEHLKNGNTMNALQQQGPWDYVVLQERSFFPLRDQKRMETACSELDSKIRAVNAKTVLMMTWANKGELAYQPTISSEYKKISRSLGARLVPVGDVMTNAMEQNPTIQFYQSDAHHGSEACAYLAACMLYSNLVGDVKHLPMDIERSLPFGESEVEKLRTLASGGSVGSTSSSSSTAPTSVRSRRITTTSGRSIYRHPAGHSSGSSRNSVQNYKWK